MWVCRHGARRRSRRTASADERLATQTTVPIVAGVELDPEPPHGFLGILERRCLFASDVWFLNDASEVRYAQTRMLEQVRKWTEDQPWVEELLEV